MASAFQRFELLRRKRLTPTEPSLKADVFSAARFVSLEVLSFRSAGWGTQACLLRFAGPGGQPLGGYDRTAPTGPLGTSHELPWM